MVRSHRSLAKRLKRIDANRVANLGDDYLDGFRLFKKDLEGARRLPKPDRVKKLVKEIDSLNREVEKLERKIEKIKERRAAKAVKLEDILQAGMEALQDSLSPVDYRDFWNI